MSRRTLPLIVGTLLILAMVGYVFIHRSSPGDLSRAHAAVAGSNFILDCKKCHTSEGLTAGCLKCHSEIQTQLLRQNGYHAYLARNKKTECGPCHSDHNGAEFALVNQTSWEGKDVKTFKHPHVAFHLVGAHETLSCGQCHQAKNHSAFALPQFPKSVRADTYLSLSQTCISCHADPHAGGKAANCQACHDQTHWKPAPSFNHDKYYPLRGVHATIACSQCHATPRGAASAIKTCVVFGPMKGTRCLDCHTNPHRVKWLDSCEACHKGIDKSWSDADSRLTKTQHALTGFALNAPHNKARCLDCHNPATLGKSFAARYPNPQSSGYDRSPNDCEGCHRDEHRGQFISKYPKCILCHNLSGWKPSKFNVPMHSRTSYPLIGKHSTVECRKCHTRDPDLKTIQYTRTPTDCFSCHHDIHYGQFRKENNKTRCETCHLSTVQWSKIIFDHETQSKFKLGEAHRNVACKQCHPVVVLRNGVRLTQYKPIKSQCSDCHGFDDLQNR